MSNGTRFAPTKKRTRKVATIVGRYVAEQKRERRRAEERRRAQGLVVDADLRRQFQDEAQGLLKKFKGREDSNEALKAVLELMIAYDEKRIALCNEEI